MGFRERRSLELYAACMGLGQRMVQRQEEAQVRLAPPLHMDGGMLGG